MRLIDADALMETLGIKEHCEDCQYHHHDVYCNRSCDFVTACEAISDAPTIEPKRKGKWIGADSQCGIGCPFCGTPVDDFCSSIDYIDLNYEPNFCPNCGADMREGVE